MNQCIICDAIITKSKKGVLCYDCWQKEQKELEKLQNVEKEETANKIYGTTYHSIEKLKDFDKIKENCIILYGIAEIIEYKFKNNNFTKGVQEVITRILRDFKNKTNTEGMIKCENCGELYYCFDSCNCKDNKQSQNQNNIINKQNEKHCIICNQTITKSKEGKLCYDCWQMAKEQKKELDYIKTPNEAKEYYNNLKFSIFKMKKIEYAQNACQKLYALASIIEENYHIDNFKEKSLIEIQGLLQKKEEFIKEKEKEKTFKPNKQKTKEEEIKEDYGKNIEDYRTTYPAKIRCTDGHYVRSKAERDIDNYLYNNKIFHIYEPFYIAKDGQTYYPDFKLTELNLYIEYFGINDERYFGKTTRKIEIYTSDTSTKFEYLYPKDDNNIEDKLDKIIWNRKSNNLK